MTEPSSFEEAVQQKIWVDAMVEEYDSIIENNAWEFFPRSVGKSVVGSRWIYKVKQKVDGSVEKYKPRFVARDSHKLRGLTMRILLHKLRGTHPLYLSLHS